MRTRGTFKGKASKCGTGDGSRIPVLGGIERHKSGTHRAHKYLNNDKSDVAIYLGLIDRTN